MVVRQVDDLAIRKHAAHAFGESFPLVAAEEAVAEQEAAAQQVVAQLVGVLVGEFPESWQANDQVGPVEHIIAIFQVHRLLDRAHVDGGEATQDACVEAVAPGVVDGPGGAALAPVATESAKPA